MISGIRTANTDPTMPVVKLMKSFCVDGLGVFSYHVSVPQTLKASAKARTLGLPGIQLQRKTAAIPGLLNSKLLTAC